ncbi:oligosaccharide flippase family protein [Ruminococcus sp. FC2018]|uniref:oligosaccharide flippase family protein n=1 Tax=Ruminococcus sp. FC2018 TaxID=1410617 RepID=UPI00048E33BF|nr:oligosaccharide flippase family protein [Ruminococcus sp. FC2018]
MVKVFVQKYRSMPIQLRASIWFLLCSFLQKGVSMITTPVFTRIMSTKEYGQYGTFSSWLGIVTILISLNMYLGVHAQGIVKFSDEHEKFTSSIEGLTTMLASVWMIIYVLFRNFWNELLSMTTPQVLAMVVIIWSTAIFNFWANEQRLKYTYKALVIVTLLVSIIKPVFEFLLVVQSNEKVTARVLGWMIVDFAAYSWMHLFHLIKGKTFFSRKYWRYALLFSIPLIPHYLSATILNSADRIMIKEMIGEGESGIYNLAYSVAIIMTLFSTALSQTVTPWMYQKIKAKKNKEIAPIAYVSLIIIAIANLLLIVFAPEVIRVFAPKEYYEAVWIIPPVSMSCYFLFSYDLFAKYAFYYEKTKIIMLVSIIGAMMNIVLNLVFIRIFGYIAAGYTTLICYIIFASFHYLLMRYVCRNYCEKDYPYDTRIVLVISVIFILVGFFFLFLYTNTFLRYIVILLVVLTSAIFHKKIKYAVVTIVRIRKNDITNS